MTWLLRHNFWLVKLLGLVVVTALLANTTTTLVALYLLSGAQPIERAVEEDEPDEDEPTGLAQGKSGPGDRARQAERTAEQILGRNVFCPSCGPTPVDEPAEGPSDASGPD
ncbi:MAG: hypothetical protein KDK70_40500, partial [Myxococcales bacterium]|nr:hypothetical protein [Myxococcales bacterium]